jgi:hypothetical protein
VRDAGGDAFELSTLGVMLLNLKQMVGRLIRSEDDRGLVVVCRSAPRPRLLQPHLGGAAARQRVLGGEPAELPALIAELGLGK